MPAPSGKTRLIEDDVGRSTSPVVDGVSAVSKAEELYAGELAGVAHAHILAEEAAAVFVHHDDGRLAVPVGARAHAAVHLAVGFDASAVTLPFDAVHVMEPCAGGLAMSTPSPRVEGEPVTAMSMQARMYSWVSSGLAS